MTGMTKGKKKARGSQTIPVALLLAVIGGYLDAYSYYARGGVFATAQTGNVVKMAIAAAEGQTALPFLLPIAAFVLGVVVSLGIDTLLSRGNDMFVRRPIILFELLLTAGVALIPDTNHNLANMLISFVCGMQMTIFGRFGDLSINTTVHTGNIKNLAEHVFKWAAGGDGRKQSGKAALTYLGVILSFMLGALAGVFLTKRFLLHSVLWLIVPYLAIIGLITIHNNKHNISSAEGEENVNIVS